MLRHKLSEMSHYNKAAEEYSRTDAQAEPLLKKEITQLCLAKRPRRIIDLGCGTGRYVSSLRGDEMVGVDTSIEMLTQAKSRYPNVDLVLGDIFFLPFRNEGFDMATSMSVLGEHLPVAMEILSEVKRLLTDNGVFAFTFCPAHHYGLRLLILRISYSLIFTPLLGKSLLFKFSDTKRGCVNKLHRAGFEVVQAKEVHAIRHHFLICASVLRTKAI